MKTTFFFIFWLYRTKSVMVDDRHVLFLLLLVLSVWKDLESEIKKNKKKKIR